MGTLSLRLPESVHSRVRALAKKDGVSANQFIATAVAEKAAAMLALEAAPHSHEASLFGTLADVLDRQKDVLFGYVFGSQALGAAGPRSDVDVAVYLAPGVDAFESRIHILGALQSALRTDAVDLLVLNTAPLSIAGRMLLTRRVLVDQDPHARHRYESLTAREFSDFRIREHRLLDLMVKRG